MAAADDALSRLDERLRVSPIREGWIARTHFLDACASAWIDGELAHVEDLVLHDASMDIRLPTHELTKAHAVLRARRRIISENPKRALSPAGLTALTGRASPDGREGQGAQSPESRIPEELEPSRLESDEMADGPLAGEFAGLDAIAARSNRLLSALAPGAPSGRDPMVYDLDWNEQERLAEWRGVVDETEGLPPLLGAALALLAWEDIEPLQHRAWRGRLLIGASLRARSRTWHHLLCANIGLRAVIRERRRAQDPTTRLVAALDAFAQAARSGMKEHDRWLLARRQLDRKLMGRRSNSSLPALADLVISWPVLSVGMIARELKVTPRAAQNLVAELELREMTGRGRYRAWGIL